MNRSGVGYLAILLLAALAAPVAAGIPQKGIGKGKGGSRAERACGCREHGCRCDLPIAPILGSAPAMMAPLVLTPASKPP